MDAVIHHRDDSAEDPIVLIVLNFTELQHGSIFWPLTFSFVFSADRLQEIFCAHVLCTHDNVLKCNIICYKIFLHISKIKIGEYKKNYSKLQYLKSESRCHRRTQCLSGIGIGYADDWHDWVYLWCWKSPESCVVNVEKFSVVILRKCNSSANTQQMFRTLAPSTVVRLQFLTLPPTWLGNVTSTLLTGILHKPVYL